MQLRERVIEPMATGFAGLVHRGRLALAPLPVGHPDGGLNGELDGPSCSSTLGSFTPARSLGMGGIAQLGEARHVRGVLAGDLLGQSDRRSQLVIAVT